MEALYLSDAFFATHPPVRKLKALAITKETHSLTLIALSTM